MDSSTNKNNRNRKNNKKKDEDGGGETPKKKPKPAAEVGDLTCSVTFLTKKRNQSRIKWCELASVRARACCCSGGGLAETYPRHAVRRLWGPRVWLLELA